MIALVNETHVQLTEFRGKSSNLAYLALIMFPLIGGASLLGLSLSGTSSKVEVAG